MDINSNTEIKKTKIKINSSGIETDALVIIPMDGETIAMNSDIEPYEDYLYKLYGVVSGTFIVVSINPFNHINPVSYNTMEEFKAENGIVADPVSFALIFIKEKMPTIDIITPLKGNFRSNTEYEMTTIKDFLN